MLTLSNYHISETLEEGFNTLIYKGARKEDLQPVIIKVLKAEYPSLEQITRLKHEYKITLNLDLKGVVMGLQPGNP